MNSSHFSQNYNKMYLLPCRWASH